MQIHELVGKVNRVAIITMLTVASVFFCLCIQRVSAWVFDNKTPFAVGGYTPLCRSGSGTAQCGGFISPTTGGLGKALDTADPLDGQSPVYSTATGTYIPTTVVPAGGNSSVSIVAICDGGCTQGHVAKRVLATSHVTEATGSTAGSGDLVIGLFLSTVADAQPVSVIKSGGFYPSILLTQGKLFRKSDATLSLFSGLASGDYTNMLCVASSTGCDMAVSEGQQVP